MNVEEIVEGKIRAIFFKEVVGTVIAKAVAAAPFLGLPVIGPIFSWIVGWLAGKFYEEAKLRGVFLAIDLNENRKAVAYERAVAEFREVLKNPLDQDEKKKAEEKYRATLRELIRINATDRTRRLR